ncbi:MAG TPA: substrate-binding domain-containing protein, partial [Roseiflexaceae bacterium]|nr:substrate-binding domain-containing protein [Roseiflexaceae bacterium]
YHHNTTASNLRRADQRTATIGLLLDDVANPFSSALYRAIEDVARQHDTLVFAGSSDEDPSREEKMVLTLASRRVDGLIVVPTSRSQGGLAHIQRLDRPIVFVDRPAIFHDADSVTVDNRAGARQAICHMAAYGHRNIAFLGDIADLWTSAERYLGYVEGLATAGLQLNPRMIRKNLRGIEAAERATLELLDDESQAPTAIFASQNLVTIGAIRALQGRGLQHRIAVIGFDDFLLADLLHPRVSVIAQQPATLGRMAADLLFARLDGDRSPPQHIVVPTQLIPRGSGEIAAIEPK